MSSVLEILFADFSPWSLIELKCAECRTCMLDFVMVRLWTKKAMEIEIFHWKFRFGPCQGALVVVIFIQKKVIYRNICFISIVRFIIIHFSEGRGGKELGGAKGRIVCLIWLWLGSEPKGQWRWRYSDENFVFALAREFWLLLFLFRRKWFTETSAL